MAPEASISPLMSRFFKSAAFPILIVVVLAFFAQKLIIGPGSPAPKQTYGDFISELQAGQVRSVDVKTKDNTIAVTLRNGQKYERGFLPDNADRLESRLENAKQSRLIQDYDVEGTKSNGWLSLLTYVLPFLIFIGFWIFLMNQVQGGGSKVMSFGKSRAKRMSVDSPKITFRDVAGVDEAVEELHEIKEFLENPKKFQALGARIPKGVLLYGPPGTGKTLLARAVAGEAGVPFFSISGSDFVEMFVGVGASRVRDLFEQAKQNSPCIIFMDEIDAVGRHRGAGLGGGHDEREQTLNQLLVEMDGFEMKDNIILIAATNRPDILDPALLRPGRFDRQIVVDRPDRKGRSKILEVHTRGKPLAKEIDVDALAGQTPGFTGADLSNLVNEAALLSARNGKREITQVELEEGIMRVIAGPEKKTRVMSDKERLITAYHEMGHAIVGHYLEHSDPVHKISIISRGQALGYTISMPQEDRFLTTRAELTDNLAMTLGGRAAEEIVFSEITTGASNDLEKVTATAKQMVMRFGMSEKLGPRVFGHDHGQPFLGREFSAEPDYSDEIAREIDDEIRRIVEAAHQRAKDLLTEYRDSLATISQILLKRETIEKEEFEALLAGKSEEDVFGTEAPPPPSAPVPGESAPERPGREAPRPLPRPGLAGGGVEARGLELPEKPELA
jgi:cell division protease FtsH